MKNKTDVATNMERTDIILKLNHSDFSGKLPKGCAIPQKIFALIGKFDTYFLTPNCGYIRLLMKQA